MAPPPPRLRRLLARLARQHGARTPPSRDPWHLILLENVAYLTTPDARQRAFEHLVSCTDLDPATIARCPDELLLEACGHGKMAAQQVRKLRDCARLFAEVGDPRELVALPIAKAKRQLQRFPGIGAPGAERLLLLARREAPLALESNGLRVLLRLGYGTAAKSYSTSYRSAQTAAMAELPATNDALVSAHLLLQRHGQQVCRNTRPACDECILRDDCPSTE